MPKKRKGKQASGRSTPSSLTPPPSAAPSDNEEEAPSRQDTLELEETKPSEPEKEETATPTTTQQHQQQYSKDDFPLVLTSEKKRGIYECDYCHSDISQLPRIRCAVCPDFDLCLDCFATTDHTSAIARLKAAANTHSELSKDGIESTMVSGISSAAANHDHTHGYRVCDSTRYPIFGSARTAMPVKEQRQDNNMDLDSKSSNEDRKSTTITTSDAESNVSSSNTDTTIMVISEDPKGIWTAEEDLRLLDAIKTHGLGNWQDVSEAIGGNGSVGKTSKRCMERYFDDFLGRYGHILPPYTITDEYVEDDPPTSSSTVNNNNNNDPDPSNNNNNNKPEEEDAVRVSKRRQALMARMPSNLSSSSVTGGRARKRLKVVRTEALPGYSKLWPEPYLPAVDGVKVGQEVARDLSKKAELAFVKATADVSTKEAAEKIKKEWVEARMNQLGAPTVLPPRPEDTALLPGANLMGFMPRRGDFDVEWENDAEQAIADMEFTQGDLPHDKHLKLQVLEIYYQKQEEREKRKKFIMSRELYDYRKFLQDEQKSPSDERDLIHRLRLFERFHTPEEHKQFIVDILKAKRLRKEIATLQMYRRIGIRSLLEAEKYEIDKERRQFHKVAQLQKDASEKAKSAPSAASATATAGSTTTNASAAHDVEPIKESLWKQYRNSDRKIRRSMNRTESGLTPEKNDEESTEKKDVEMKDDNDGKVEGDDDKKKEGEDVEMKDASAAPAPDEKQDQATEQQDPTEPAKQDEEAKVSDEPVVATEEETKEEDEFDITKAKGFDLLSRKEVSLCMRLNIFPLQYLEIKKALIHESLKKGLLDKEGPGSTRRMIVKVDVEKRGNILDFLVRAGWISKSLAKVARSVTPTTDQKWQTN